MLKLKIVLSDDFDNEKQEFVTETVDVELEHSLASLSKWEEKYEVPLLGNDEKTEEQNLYYLECMCLTPNIAPEVFTKLSQEQADQIAAHIDRKHSATWFNSELPKARSGETITAELIYYWLSGFQIDWQTQYWPLNKLLTLIKVHSVKADNKPVKQSGRARRESMTAEIMRRRKELGSNG